MIRDEIAKTAATTLKSNAPDTGSQDFYLSADFIGFHGHFPGYPLLPAMLQALFGVMVSEKITGEKLILKKLAKAKFTTQIKPEDTISVSSKIIKNPGEPAEITIKAQVVITVAEKKAATMTLLLEPV